MENCSNCILNDEKQKNGIKENICKFSGTLIDDLSNYCTQHKKIEMYINPKFITQKNKIQ